MLPRARLPGAGATALCRARLAAARLGAPFASSAAAAGPEAPAEAAAAAGESKAEEKEEEKDEEKVLVLGGSGFVGSRVCQELLRQGKAVVAVNRRGQPSSRSHPWAARVDWVRGDALEPEGWRPLLGEVGAVVSAVGGFGDFSDAQLRRLCGEANVVAVQEAKAAGVPRFAFISAHAYPFLRGRVLKGYWEGKQMVEDALDAEYPEGGVYLRPGFIHGTKAVGALTVPLGLVGAPLEALMANPVAKGVITNALPAPLGGLLCPPVGVETVARAAVAAATDPALRGAMTVWDILAYKSD